jgi:beta-xylosidase
MILCGLIVMTPVIADYQWSSLVSSSTSVSGNVVVNETVSVKKVTYTDGFPKIQEMKFQNTIENPAGSTWKTELFSMPTSDGTKFTFSRTGSLFPQFSFMI